MKVSCVCARRGVKCSKHPSYKLNVASSNYLITVITVLATGRGRGGVYPCHAWPSRYNHRPLHPHKAGTEHVGFPPTRHTLLAPNAKCREVFDELRER